MPFGLPLEIRFVKVGHGDSAIGRLLVRGD